MGKLDSAARDVRRRKENREASGGGASFAVSALLEMAVGSALAASLSAAAAEAARSAAFCAAQPRTPSTALKKFVEPVAMVLDTASRAGASCCSNFISWMPSVSLSPMSETTEGFSLQGCLTCIVSGVRCFHARMNSHLASTMSNIRGSVIAFHTS